MNIKILIIIVVFFLNACKSTGDLFNSNELIFNPDVEVGTLSNGFRFYIAKNDRPESRVYIRFVVNAGSMNEEEDQRGVAHIVEHMAFNGTENYPKNEVINILEKYGMKFGVDINAFTDFENTVYKLNLPNNNDDLLNLSFNIISDWASKVTMLKDDLDSERGIVLEEWRARLSPMLRIANKKSTIELAGSRYVTRDPIGEVDTINNVSKYRVSDFYYKWYRPDNMSIVVVGDIDPDRIKLILEQKFSSLKVPTTSLKHPNYDVPLYNGWRSAIVSEDGISSPSIELSFFSAHEVDYTYDRYKNDLALQVAMRLLNVRLQVWEQDKIDIINSANFYSSNVTKSTTQSVFSLQLKDQEYLKAFQNIINFIGQVFQYGFSAEEINGELVRLKALNHSLKNKKNYSVDIAGDLMVSAATGQLFVSEKHKYSLNKLFLDEITVQDVNMAFKRIIEPQSRLLLITQPYGQNSSSIPVVKLSHLWHEAMNAVQPKWLINLKKSVLPRIDINRGRLKKEKVWAKDRITEYRLENGNKLIYKYSNTNPGQVHFKAITSGGLRSVGSEDYHALRIASTLVDETGIGSISKDDIFGIFQNHPIAMSTVMNDYYQGFSGWANAEDFEKMLHLFRIKLETSPISEKVFSQYQFDLLKKNENNLYDGSDKFAQQISLLRFPNLETVYSEDFSKIKSLTSKNLSDIYRKYVLEKTDFTYFILGDISQNEIEKFAAKYLASLDVIQQNRKTYKVSARVPSKRYSLEGSKEPRAEVELYLTKYIGWRPDHALYLELAGEVIQEKLRARLREQASGVYNVTSWFWHDSTSSQAEGIIRFTCAPDRVDELIYLTHQTLNSFQNNGSDLQILQNKISQKEDEIDRFLRSDLGILSALENSYMLTDSPVLIYARQRAIKVAMQEKIDNLMKSFLEGAGRFEAVLLPKRNLY